MKVFGKSKDSLERDSRIRQKDLAQSKMRSLLGEDAAVGSGEDLGDVWEPDER